jgi:hypothetical protein
MASYLTKFDAWRTATSTQDDAATTPAAWTPRALGGLAPLAERYSQPDSAVKIYGWSNRSVTFYGSTVPACTTWDLIDGDPDRAQAEVLVGLRAGYGACEPVVRQQSGAATYYYARFDPATGGTLSLWKTVAGVDTSLGSTSVAADASGLYYLRLRAAGNTIQARCWGRDALETSATLVSATDSTIGGAGAVGMRQGVIEFFSISTRGTSAIKPATLQAANSDLARAMITGKQVVMLCDIEVPAYTGSATVAGRVVRRYSNVTFDTNSTPAAQGSPAPANGLMYSARLKAIPTVAREMADLSGGVVKVGGADIELDNADGALDELFRMRLFRMPVVCRIGLPSWPWYDFLPYHQGVIQDVADRDSNTLVLGVDGSARELDGEVPLTYSTTGPNAGRMLPQQAGAMHNITPVLTDATLLRYQFAKTGGIAATEVRDRGSPLVTRAIPLTAVDVAADWVESAADHGLLVGDPVVFSSGLPAPLVVGVNYFVATVVTARRFTVSATRGGGALDLTGTTGAITCTATYQPWIYSLTGGGVELSKKPEGMVTMDLDIGNTTSRIKLMLLAGFPEAKTAMFAGGFYVVPGNIYVKDRQSRMTVIESMAAAGVPVTFNRSGAMAWRAINFANVETVITEADCLGVPRLLKTLQPASGRVGEPNWTVQNPSDLAGAVSAANVVLYGLPQYYLVTAVGIDMVQGLWWGGLVDDPALYRDTLPDKSVGGIASTVTLTSTGYTALNSSEARQRAAGIYEITTVFKSALLDCGDVVELTHRRHFFKRVTNENDISPERPATAIGAKQQPSLAVVIKIIDNPEQGRQTLTLYRPMPTYFPTN